MPSFSSRSLLPFRRTTTTEEIVEHARDATEFPEQRVQPIEVPRRSAEVLKMLPPELCSRVSSYLRPVDIAALALSTQLTRSYFESVRQCLADQDKYEFLLRLKDWYPTHRACMHCLRYRDFNSQTPRYNVQHDPCAPNKRFDIPLFAMRNRQFMSSGLGCECDPFAGDPTFPLDTISWPAIQMAKRACDFSSTSGLALDSLAFETDANLTKAHWSIKTQAMISKTNHILIKVECERPLRRYRNIGKSDSREMASYDCREDYVD